MNTLTIPRLRDEVIVRPFDDGGTLPRYVVAVDGHHFVVAPAIAALLDETRNLVTDVGALEVLAQRVSQRLGTVVTSRQVETLLRERIPKALFEPAKGVNADDGPLLFRRILLTGTTLQPLLTAIAKLFALRAAIALCLLVLSIDVLVALRAVDHGASVASAADLAWGLALTLCGIFLHELGHLAACHRFGGQHGGVGIGIYWCLPAFYAEVHGAWTLPRRQRAAVDVGGVYLQSLFVGVLGTFYLVSALPGLLNAIVLTHLLMLHTLNPVLKFDGYWLLSDLAGIHNLHRRVRDTARSILQRSAVAPTRGELGLLAAFIAIALLYFAYLLAVLGHNLGLTGASFLSATATADRSVSALLDALGHGVLFAFVLAMAIGVAVLLAQAAGAVLKENSK